MSLRLMLYERLSHLVRNDAKLEAIADDLARHGYAEDEVIRLLEDVMELGREIEE